MKSYLKITEKIHASFITCIALCALILTACGPEPPAEPVDASPVEEEEPLVEAPAAEPEDTLIPSPPAHCRQSILEPTEPIHAMHIGGNWGLNWEETNTLQDGYFEYLKSLNVDWVGISVGLHYQDSMDSTVERVYSGVEIPTFTDEFLKDMIHKFHQNGICVYLTMALESPEAQAAAHPVIRYQLGEPRPVWGAEEVIAEFWPWDIDHPDHERFVAEFWESYTDQAVHFGQLAEQEGVALFSLGTETEGLFRTRPNDDWPNDFSSELRAMVASVREVYSGALTYDMLPHALSENDPFRPGSKYLWEDLDLDVIGLSAYFQLADSLPTNVMSVEALEERWEAIFQEYLIPLRDANPDRPVFFTEFGYVDSVGAPNQPNMDEISCRVFSDADANGLDDGEETQANIYQALFNIMDKHNGVVNGIFTWDTFMADNELWANTYAQLREWSVRDKLAEDIVRSNYGAEPRISRAPLYLNIPTEFDVEESFVIYADELEAGWEIGSWEADIQTDIESVVHGGQTALGVTLNGGGGNISFSNPQDISKYAYLEFFINGGSQGGQDLGISFVDEKTQEQLVYALFCRVTQSTPLPPDEWVLIRFPLQQLDIRDRHVSIYIFNDTEQQNSQFYLDDIRLVAEGQ